MAAFRGLLEDLSFEARSLAVFGDHVPRLQFAQTSPLEFYREYVAQNRPCVIEGAVDHWPALSHSLWTDEYLEGRLGSSEVHVDITPDGKGDAVVKESGAAPLRLREDVNARLCTCHDGVSPSSVAQVCSLRREKRDVDAAVQQDSSGRDSGCFNSKNFAEADVHEKLDRDGSEGSEGSEGRHVREAPVDIRNVGTTENGVCTNGNHPSCSCCTHDCSQNCNSHRNSSIYCDGDGPPADHWFATPYVAKLTFSSFLRRLSQSRTATRRSCVPYVQHQNNSLHKDFSCLLADVAPDIPLVTSALGCGPEAVNLWVGDERAETSWHKDHYENMYAVVAGKKHFLLLPPCDVRRMCVRDYRAAHYWCPQVDGDGPLYLVPDDSPRSVPWASVDAHLDPLPWLAKQQQQQQHRLEKGHPWQQLKGPPPLAVTLCPGELLYLPAMWYHHVRQTPDDHGRTIAVNYWYDMAFDIKYAYYKFVESIVENDRRG